MSIVLVITNLPSVYRFCGKGLWSSRYDVASSRRRSSVQIRADPLYIIANVASRVALRRTNGCSEFSLRGNPSRPIIYKNKLVYTKRFRICDSSLMVRIEPCQGFDPGSNPGCRILNYSTTNKFSANTILKSKQILC